MDLSSVLVAHPWIENGGSEATAMWTLRALQDQYDVTLVTSGDVDIVRLNDAFGAGVDASKLKIVQAPRIPMVKQGTRVVGLQHSLFHRFCQKIAPAFDCRISSYNFVPFGVPSLQLVGDLSFDEVLRRKFYIHDYQKIYHQNIAIRTAYLKMVELVTVKDPAHVMTENVVLANSEWTASHLKKHKIVDECSVIYPPVPLPETYDPQGVERDPVSFLYLGRVSPEKEIEKIIEILEQVRNRGFEIKMDLCGNENRSGYEKMITQMAAERDWISDLGYVSGADKEKAFFRNSFGIQACRCEAFGIAAAEMAARGCVPLVPEGCGPAEVVPYSELQFANTEAAVEKSIDLLEFPEQAEALRQKVIAGTSRFNSAEFVKNVRGYVESMLQNDSPKSPPHHVSQSQDLSTTY